MKVCLLMLFSTLCLLTYSANALLLLTCRDDSVEVERIEMEEEKQLTLDEWKAMQERNRVKPAFNIRKPETRPEWKKMFVLKKKIADEEEDEYEEYEEVNLTFMRALAALLGIALNWPSNDCVMRHNLA